MNRCSISNNVIKEIGELSGIDDETTIHALSDWYSDNVGIPFYGAKDILSAFIEEDTIPSYLGGGYHAKASFYLGNILTRTSFYVSDSNEPYNKTTLLNINLKRFENIKLSDIYEFINHEVLKDYVDDIKNEFELLKDVYDMTLGELSFVLMHTGVYNHTSKFDIHITENGEHQMIFFNNPMALYLNDNNDLDKKVDYISKKYNIKDINGLVYKNNIERRGLLKHKDSGLYHIYMPLKRHNVTEDDMLGGYPSFKEEVENTIKNSDLNTYTKAFILDLINRSGAPFVLINSSDIVDLGIEYKGQGAFVYKGVIYIVDDLLDKNVAIHELLHIYVKALKELDPTSFNKIVKRVRKKMGYNSVYYDALNKYNGSSDLAAEETLTVFLTDVYSQKSWEEIQKLHNEHSWLKQMWNNFVSWLEQILNLKEGTLDWLKADVSMQQLFTFLKEKDLSKYIFKWDDYARFHNLISTSTNNIAYDDVFSLIFNFINEKQEKGLLDKHLEFVGSLRDVLKNIREGRIGSYKAEGVSEVIENITNTMETEDRNVVNKLIKSLNVDKRLSVLPDVIALKDISYVEFANLFRSMEIATRYIERILKLMDEHNTLVLSVNGKEEADKMIRTELAVYLNIFSNANALLSIISKYSEFFDEIMNKVNNDEEIDSDISKKITQSIGGIKNSLIDNRTRLENMVKDLHQKYLLDTLTDIIWNHIKNDSMTILDTYIKMVDIFTSDKSIKNIFGLDTIQELKELQKLIIRLDETEKEIEQLKAKEKEKTKDVRDIRSIDEIHFIDIRIMEGEIKSKEAERNKILEEIGKHNEKLLSVKLSVEALKSSGIPTKQASVISRAFNELKEYFAKATTNIRHQFFTRDSIKFLILGFIYDNKMVSLFKSTLDLNDPIFNFFTNEIEQINSQVALESLNIANVFNELNEEYKKAGGKMENIRDLLQVKTVEVMDENGNIVKMDVWELLSPIKFDDEELYNAYSQLEEAREELIAAIGMTTEGGNKNMFNNALDKYRKALEAYEKLAMNYHNEMSLEYRIKALSIKEKYKDDDFIMRQFALFDFYSDMIKRLEAAIKLTDESKLNEGIDGYKNTLYLLMYYKKQRMFLFNKRFKLSDESGSLEVVERTNPKEIEAAKALEEYYNFTMIAFDRVYSVSDISNIFRNLHDSVVQRLTPTPNDKTLSYFDSLNSSLKANLKIEFKRDEYGNVIYIKRKEEAQKAIERIYKYVINNTKDEETRKLFTDLLDITHERNLLMMNISLINEQIELTPESSDENIEKIYDILLPGLQKMEDRLQELDIKFMNLIRIARFYIEETDELTLGQREEFNNATEVLKTEYIVKVDFYYDFYKSLRDTINSLIAELDPIAGGVDAEIKIQRLNDIVEYIESNFLYFDGRDNNESLLIKATKNHDRIKRFIETIIRSKDNNDLILNLNYILFDGLKYDDIPIPLIVNASKLREGMDYFIRNSWDEKKFKVKRHYLVQKFEKDDIHAFDWGYVIGDTHPLNPLFRYQYGQYSPGSLFFNLVPKKEYTTPKVVDKTVDTNGHWLPIVFYPVPNENNPDGYDWKILGHNPERYITFEARKLSGLSTDGISLDTNPYLNRDWLDLRDTNPELFDVLEKTRKAYHDIQIKYLPAYYRNYNELPRYTADFVDSLYVKDKKYIINAISLSLGAMVEDTKVTNIIKEKKIPVHVKAKLPALYGMHLLPIEDVSVDIFKSLALFTANSVKHHKINKLTSILYAYDVYRDLGILTYDRKTDLINQIREEAIKEFSKDMERKLLGNLNVINNSKRAMITRAMLERYFFNRNFFNVFKEELPGKLMIAAEKNVRRIAFFKFFGFKIMMAVKNLLSAFVGITTRTTSERAAEKGIYQLPIGYIRGFFDLFSSLIAAIKTGLAPIKSSLLFKEGYNKKILVILGLDMVDDTAIKLLRDYVNFKKLSLVTNIPMAMQNLATNTSDIYAVKSTLEAIPIVINGKKYKLWDLLDVSVSKTPDTPLTIIISTKEVLDDGTVIPKGYKIENKDGSLIIGQDMLNYIKHIKLVSQNYAKAYKGSSKPLMSQDWRYSTLLTMKNFMFPGFSDALKSFSIDEKTGKIRVGYANPMGIYALIKYSNLLNRRSALNLLAAIFKGNTDNDVHRELLRILYTHIGLIVNVNIIGWTSYTLGFTLLKAWRDDDDDDDIEYDDLSDKAKRIYMTLEQLGASHWLYHALIYNTEDYEEKRRAIDKYFLVLSKYLDTYSDSPYITEQDLWEHVVRLSREFSIEKPFAKGDDKLQEAMLRAAHGDIDDIEDYLDALLDDKYSKLRSDLSKKIMERSTVPIPDFMLAHNKYGDPSKEAWLHQDFNFSSYLRGWTSQTSLMVLGEEATFNPYTMFSSYAPYSTANAISSLSTPIHMSYITGAWNTAVEISTGKKLTRNVGPFKWEMKGAPHWQHTMYDMLIGINPEINLQQELQKYQVRTR